LERPNEELRHREKCIRIIPHEGSCARMIGAVLQGYSEDWTSGKLYLSESLERIRDHRKKPTAYESTRKEVILKIVLDSETKMKISAVYRVTIYGAMNEDNKNVLE